MQQAAMVLYRRRPFAQNALSICQINELNCDGLGLSRHISQSLRSRLLCDQSAQVQIPLDKGPLCW